MRKSVAIAGGGLTGALAALDLARRGWRATLFDRRPRILQGASRNNEGKLHLGFTYAMDGGGATARLLTRHGNEFLPILCELTGRSADHFVTAERSMYAIPRDSWLDAAQSESYLRGVCDGLAGIGRPADMRRLDPAEAADAFSERMEAVFEVPETFVSTDKVCDAVEEAVLASPAIEVVTDTQVASFEGEGRPGVLLADGRRLGPFDAAVNSSWEGLADIASGSGAPLSGLCIRAKAGFIARVEAGMPRLPLTFAYGAFGDIVPVGGDMVYLSWYPACQFGFAPSADNGVAWYEGVHERFDAKAAYRASREAFEALCPGLRLADAFDRVRAGAIVAAGRTDIHDTGSGLHTRTAIGVSRRGAIYSVDSGKFTSTPHMARALGDAIAG
ncbi:MAG: FAD-dependent oxidoreductase [Flavobacteriaceae bacterium]